MTREEQNSGPEDIREVMRLMCVRIRNAALRHFEHIDARTLRVLQDLELYGDDALPIGDSVDLAVLRDPQHPRRQNRPDGPLVLYVTDEKEPKRMVVELPVLFFSDNQEVRQSALACIEKMVVDDSLAITPKTSALLQQTRDALGSDAPSDWRPAAVAASDALFDDALIALRGTRQSLECQPVIEDRLNFYSSRIMFPSVTSLDSIRLAGGNPEKDHEALARVLTEIVSRSNNLAGLCSAYLAELGYLPLAPPYCLATAVSSWLVSNPEADAWKGVWDWANTESTPLSRYHACSVFVLLPELVPDGKLPVLWKEVIAVVHDSSKNGADHFEHETWALRRDLTRHYVFHLEARLPDSDGASIGCFAWWFAEQVARLFPAEQGAAMFYRKNWVKPASDLSSHVWLAASSPIQRSFLRYVTFSTLSPWAVALLALMGEHLEELSPADQEEEIQVRFNEAVIANTVSCLPLSLDTPSDVTFALELSLAATVLKWAEYQTVEQQNALRQFVATSQMLGTNDGLCNALRTLGESSLADQIAVCLALKAKAYTDPTLAEDVWAVVSDAGWRDEVLGNADTRVQDLLVECFSLLLVDNREKWFSLLPHYIADLCEKAHDEERRRILFLYVIHTSLASDTVSAVRRLLRGEQKAKFFELARDYRAHVESMRSNYPPWVAGKLRGLMASLHIV